MPRTTDLPLSSGASPSNSTAIIVKDGVTSRATAAEMRTMIGSAGTAVEGVVALADDATALAGTDDTKAMTAAKVRAVSPVVRPEWYGGAVGATAAVNTAAIHAAIAALPTGGTIQFRAGQYAVEGLTCSTDAIVFRGASRKRTSLYCATGDLLTLSGRGSVFTDMRLLADTAAGHLIVVPNTGALTESRWSRCDLIQLAPAKSLLVFNQTTASGGGGLIDNHWTDCLFNHVTTATVPGVLVYSNQENVFSGNAFVRPRMQNGSGTVQFFDIRIEAAGVYGYSNLWDSALFEVCNGGGFRLHSLMGTELRNPKFFDNTTITADLIRLDRTGTLPYTRGTVITNYHRSGGTLSGGAVDIHCVAAGSQYTTLIAPNGPLSAGVTIDCGAASGSVVILGYDPTVVTVNNAHINNTILARVADGIRAPKFHQTATTGSIEIDGALDHDGTTVGFYGVAPVARAANPGTATGTDAAVVNAIVTALRNLGLVT